MSKSLIYYHRSYRKITGSRSVIFLQFLIATIPLQLLILIYHPEMTSWMSTLAKNVLVLSFAPGTLEIIQQKFLLSNNNIFLLIGPEAYPSTLYALISALVMIAFIAFLQIVRLDKNIAIFASFLAVIHLVSAVFFTVVPYMFPYSFNDFADLYVKTIVTIWLFIPCIMSMAILPLPASYIPKLLIIMLTLVYSFIFATVRYAIFLYVLSKFSFIYMAILFFAFGPLVDFIYIVGIYSVYTTYLARKLKEDEVVWKWLC